MDGGGDGGGDDRSDDGGDNGGDGGGSMAGILVVVPSESAPSGESVMCTVRTPIASANAACTSCKSVRGHQIG